MTLCGIALAVRYRVQWSNHLRAEVIIIIIIIIINDNVYGAVIVTMVTARVHPVHLMNAD